MSVPQGGVPLAQSGKLDAPAETTTVRSSSAAANTYLLVPIVLFFTLLIVAVLRSHSLVTMTGLGSAVIVATPLILATYALMALAIAGRGTVDLAIGPLIGFINVTLVTLFGHGLLSSPIAFFLYAFAVGVAYQLIMGLIVVFIRVQPIIVSLSGYLALSGVNLVIMERPGGTAPDWMSAWGLGISIFSPVTAILIIATVAWLLFTQTAFYGHLRLMGSDERAAYTSGVQINLVRLGAHVIAGLFVGLSALTYTSLISSGDPTQGTTYTLIAVTALVLGGASLAGGRGGVMGSLLGAVNIYLITYVLATFNFGAVQSFVTDLAYGTILVLSLLLTVLLPHIRGAVRSISPLLFFVILSLIGLGVIIHATYDYSTPGQAAAASSGMTSLSAQSAPSADTGMTSLSGETTPAARADNSGMTSLSGKPVTPAPAPADNGGMTSLSGEPVTPANPAAPAPVKPRPAVLPRTAPPRFIFESGVSASAGFATPTLAAPLAIAGLLLLSLIVILRASVAKAKENRSLSPLVYIVVTAVVLLGVYASSNHSNLAFLRGAAEKPAEPLVSQ